MKKSLAFAFSLGTLLSFSQSMHASGLKEAAGKHARRGVEGIKWLTSASVATGCTSYVLMNVAEDDRFKRLTNKQKAVVYGAAFFANAVLTVGIHEGARATKYVGEKMVDCAAHAGGKMVDSVADIEVGLKNLAVATVVGLKDCVVATAVGLKDCVVADVNGAACFGGDIVETIADVFQYISKIRFDAGSHANLILPGREGKKKEKRTTPDDDRDGAGSSSSGFGSKGSHGSKVGVQFGVGKRPKKGKRGAAPKLPDRRTKKKRGEKESEIQVASDEDEKLSGI